MSIPRELTMSAAAAIPEVWLTAYQLLHLVGGGVSSGGIYSFQWARLEDRAMQKEYH